MQKYDITNESTIEETICRIKKDNHESFTNLVILLLYEGQFYSNYINVKSSSQANSKA